MATFARWERAGRYLAKTPFIAIALAASLLAASLGLALHNEHLRRHEAVREETVQARILASSVAAALAFDDKSTTREYVDALRANPAIEAAGAFGIDGRLAAGFSRPGAALPTLNRIGAPTFEQSDLIVTEPVIQSGTRLGSVYLRARLEPWTSRVLRYAGIAIIVVMASLLVAILGSSYALVSEAHRQLQREEEGRRKAEDALRQSQKMEAMGQLTGGVAHDFNNLLMVASGGLDLLDRTSDPERRERLKQGIRQAIDRGAKLTQQLLTFARRSPLKPEVIDLGERLRGMHDLLERSLRENIVVQLSLPTKLWPVELDASQLDVAILNIAVNARDAMPDGGTLVIKAENMLAASPGEQEMVRLSVRDSGVGMAPELAEKVFEPFFTTKGVGHGTGLGLSQVYGLALASGGTVEIKSEPGLGTIVSLLLPRSHGAPAPAVTTGARPPKHVAARSRILIAEDDDQVAELVCDMTRELGYEPQRVASAAGALEVLEDGAKFDLLLSDMVMPGQMGGLDLALAVKRRWPSQPVALMTGYSEAAAAVANRDIKLLTKPYTLERLADFLAGASDPKPA